MLLSLLFVFSVYAERAPQAEPPYSNVSTGEDNILEGVEKPQRRDNKGGYIYSKKRKSKKRSPYQGVEQPVKVGEDGTYFYGDSSTKKKTKVFTGVEEPVERDDDDGSYYYRDEKKDKKSKVKFGPQPTKIRSDGSYIYSEAVDQTTSTLYIRGGVIGSPDIQPATDGGSDFAEIYGEDNRFLFGFEYDWLIAGSNTFFKLGLGVTTARGTGRFANTDGNPGLQNSDARENFDFYMIPLLTAFQYRLQIWDLQWLTPYVEAGPGYYGFAEARSDGDIKFGGAFVANAGAGILISVTKLQDGTNMASDYGATQSWIDLQFKQIFGLDSRKDFTSSMITGGFAVGF